MADQLKEIAKYGISGNKLHEGLTEDESVDVGEGKFKILISLPESLSEKKNTCSVTTIIVCVAIDEAHYVLQWLVQLYCCCFLSLNVHFELVKERTISVLKLMERTCKLKILVFL